jgi:hypothetical protein
VPVKRVDRLALSHPSSRTGPTPLVASSRAKAEGAPGETAPPPPGTGQPAPAGTAPAANAGLTENKLSRIRYAQSSQEVRRMPVGLVVVIDQAHIQDLLAAVANSPLRIQTTQFHWQRFHGDIRPESAGAPGDAGGKAGPGKATPGGELAPGGKTVAPVPPSGARAGGQQPRPDAPPGSAAAAEEQDWDLVELAVYGTASLYERPPERTQTAAGK